jgi:hypothetical protein
MFLVRMKACRSRPTGGRCSSFDYCLYPSDGIRNCHENVESAHEKSKTYEQLAIFMLRGAPEAHAACCKIAITLKAPQTAVTVYMSPGQMWTVVPEEYSMVRSRVSYLRFCGRPRGGCAWWSRSSLSVSTSRHVEIRVVQKITFAKTIQPVAICRESQCVALLVRAEDSLERNCRSIDATSDQCVRFGFPAAGMPRTF